MKPRGPLAFGFQTSILGVLVASVALMAAATLVIAATMGYSSARRTADVLFTRAGEAISQRIGGLVGAVIPLVAGASRDEDALEPIRGDGRDHPFLPFMAGVLAASPSLAQIAVGGADGTLLQLVRTDGDPRILADYGAPAGTTTVLRTLTGPSRSLVQRLTFLGPTREVLGRKTGGPVNDRPDEAPWFRLAAGQTGVVLGDPFPLGSAGEQALLVSAAFPGAKRVLVVALRLGDLGAFLAAQKVSRRAEAALVAPNGTILAMTPGFERRPGWLTKAAVRRVAGQDLSIVLTAPAGDFEADFRTMELTVAVVTLVLLALLVPLVLVLTRRYSRIMTTLGQDVDRVCQMDFSGEAPQGSRIREFDRLARGFSTMKDALSRETKVLAEAQLKLKKIVETGIALSTEKDWNTLCQLILDTAKDLTDADGGTLYLLNDEKTLLKFTIMLNDTLGTRLGGTAGPPPKFTVGLFQADGSENHHNVASHAVLTGETVNIVDAYHDDRFDFSGTKKFDEMNGYRSQSFLTVPLKPMGAEVLGALQLINAKGPDGVTIIPFNKDMEDFVEALAASAATAIYNNQLVDDLKQALKDLDQLFNAIIDVVNGAIGRKSPYTGGHCERVPVIAKMLAEATSAVESGPLAGFHLDERGLREFELAAKLHDVGKVTTPEYVVDKATKLETIYNRIHEVRTRFEVLWRDAVIHRHETVLSDKKKTAAADRELAATQAVLRDEWAFLATCNLGGEFLSPEKIERIKAIGARTWMRHFDDRLGLSADEETRIAGVPVVDLPAPETLLSDKPLHVFHHQTTFEEAYRMPRVGDGEPEAYPFRISIPEALYDQGEVYNLSIGRGTLTAEEQFKIKEHVMQSIFMLDRLPWPPGLEKVPTIAGEHHETLVGTGYPFRKTAADLSLESRILTVADIFEALTAWDRPYKKPKALSEAVKILYQFKKDRHIDADLFDLFLTSGVYRRYAEEMIAPRRPDLVDEVDIRPYLGPVSSEPKGAASRR